MKKSLILLGMSLLAACGVQKTELPLLPEEAFQTTVDGKPVALYTLHAGDITMQVTNYGARVVSLWTPDREGRYEDIVLGYENIGRYIDNTGERFLGAVVGPYANRIAKGRFTLDGAEYTLPLNNNGQTLHGGLKGVDRVVWDVVSATDDKLVLHYLHPDGQRRQRHGARQRVDDQCQPHHPGGLGADPHGPDRPGGGYAVRLP